MELTGLTLPGGKEPLVVENPNEVDSSSFELISKMGIPEPEEVHYPLWCHSCDSAKCTLQIEDLTTTHVAAKSEQDEQVGGRLLRRACSICLTLSCP